MLMIVDMQMHLMVSMFGMKTTTQIVLVLSIVLELVTVTLI